MLEHWLIELVGHVSGLSDAQLKQIEKSLPATKGLIDLLNKARPIIEQAQNLYVEAEPLIEQAKQEWQTVGPAAQILIDVISHHVNRGSSPTEAAETVRAAFGASIISVAQDHMMDRDMSCVTVSGGKVPIRGYLGPPREISAVRRLIGGGTRSRTFSMNPWLSKKVRAFGAFEAKRLFSASPSPICDRDNAA